jgi:Short C-terminal domain
MSVGRIVIACWVIFIIMCGAVRGVWLGVMAMHGLSHPAAVALAIGLSAVLWGGSFGYAMYLSFAAIRNGDRRLMKRGVPATAEVLSAKRTNTSIQSGGNAWQAPRVYKYKLRVSLPGHRPYETTCSICASGVQPGQVVNVAVSKHNRKRVVIDVGQGGGAPRPAIAGLPAQGHRRPAAAAFAGMDAPVVQRYGPAYAGPGFSSPGQPGLAGDAQRMEVLARLGQLHSQGVLTDAEFAAQKAQILGE